MVPPVLKIHPVWKTGLAHATIYSTGATPAWCAMLKLMKIFWNVQVAARRGIEPLFPG
jgi:hypothetical protein